MAIQYVVVKDARKEGTGLYYGRAIHPSTIDLPVIAERIQRNSSMTKGDVLAVLTEMVSVMKDELQNSNKVKLNGLGTFYVSLRTKGVSEEEKFNARQKAKRDAAKAERLVAEATMAETAATEPEEVAVNE